MSFISQISLLLLSEAVLVIVIVIGAGLIPFDRQAINVELLVIIDRCRNRLRLSITSTSTAASG